MEVVYVAGTEARSRVLETSWVRSSPASRNWLQLGIGTRCGAKMLM